MSASPIEIKSPVNSGIHGQPALESLNTNRRDAKGAAIYTFKGIYLSGVVSLSVCLLMMSFIPTQASASPLTEANVAEINANIDLKNMLKAIDPQYTVEKITDKNGKTTQQIKFQKKDKTANIAEKYLHGFSVDPLTADKNTVAILLGISKEATSPARDGVLYFLRKNTTLPTQWEVLHSFMDDTTHLRDTSVHVENYEMSHDYVGTQKLNDRAAAVILSQPRNATSSIYKSMFILNGNKVLEIYRSLVTKPYEESSTDTGEEETEDFSYTVVQSPYYQGQLDVAILETKSKCTSPDNCRIAETHVANYCYMKEGDYAQYDETKGHCVFKNATAASQLKGNFPATNLIDNNPRTAWAEGIAGSGIGQWTQVDFKKPATIGKVSILPGYAKDIKTWLANNRLKKARLSFSDGTKTEIDLRDRKAIESQTFTVPVKKPVTWMKIEILEVYKGEKFDDTCISEVSVAP